MAIRPNFASALLLGFFAALAVPAQAAQTPAEAPAVQEAEKPQVEVTTLFDVKAFVPGQVAHMVVVLDVPKDWHIYWSNPGGGGLPTKIAVSGPKGWKIQSPRFPGPVLRKDAGGESTYVLEGKVACFVPILPPDDAKIGQEVEFDLKVSWLMCKESCHPGSTQQKVKANVASGLPARNSARVIAAMRSFLPRRGVGMVGVGVSLSGDEKQGTLTFHALDAREFEFFAYPDSSMVVVERNSETKSPVRSARTFRLEPAAGKAPKEIAVHGVLRVKTKDRVFYYELNYKGLVTKEPADVPAEPGSTPESPPDSHGER